MVRKFGDEKAAWALGITGLVVAMPGISALSPSILLRKTVPLLKSPTGAFIAALRKREFTAWQAKKLSLMNQTTANPYCF